MGELGALFNPGMRHELEERQAKAARREEEGNARDGDLRIDLDSGVAVINVPGGQDRQPGNEAEAVAGGVETARVGDGAPTSRSAPAAAAEPEVPPGQDATTGEAGTKPDTPAAEPAAPLRPRGKRGMASAR